MCAHAEWLKYQLKETVSVGPEIKPHILYTREAGKSNDSERLSKF